MTDGGHAILDAGVAKHGSGSRHGGRQIHEGASDGGVRAQHLRQQRSGATADIHHGARPDARAALGDRDGRLLLLAGRFNNYAIVPADKFMPVDIHIPGCPPRPESLAYGILKLRAMVMSKPDEGWRSRYGGRGTEEFVDTDLQIERA